ncbi:octaprenyl diphosphate synthase [Steroidobacter denitrificans]|uniref:Octaprenyl diphosphate synthase n=1 Tax=Steroidobacter denitrificans TaxID=465721 RepID=A0A127FDG8_STEDE|nr:octaprenyl diphosphate synthase [Steroidobacter denitrificans]AMN47675.1 octaprenyl diphosphate synthase [Steroidobacter denitrificans]
MSFESIKALVENDLRQVDQVIRDRLASDVVLINQVAEYIIGSGGKRLRPLVVLVAAKACGCEGMRHAEAAAIIEFIHTATLLHDDVVDGSTLRRGRDTANEIWGNEASVLVGDYVYSRSFEMMVALGDMRIMDVMASATNQIAEGEVLQLMNTHDPTTTEERYFEVIYRKTAKLFEAGSQVAALLAGAPPSLEAAMAAYGKHLGIAFQLVDDVLDYSGSDRLGKNVGDDLAEGKPTLPLIHALRHGLPEQREIIRKSIEQGSATELARITKAIESTGGLAYTARLARREAALAIEALAELPASAYKQALRELADFAVERTY